MEYQFSDEELEQAIDLAEKDLAEAESTVSTLGETLAELKAMRQHEEILVCFRR